jgi:hypothetical protein
VNRFLVGQVIHGFAGGVFGRDSYQCRRVEAVGYDWLVTRNESGDPEFTTDLDLINPDDRDDHCTCP